MKLKQVIDCEEIDEIISKLKKYWIWEICEKLELKEQIEIGKKPWYLKINEENEGTFRPIWAKEVIDQIF